MKEMAKTAIFGSALIVAIALILDKFANTIEVSAYGFFAVLLVFNVVLIFMGSKVFRRIKRKVKGFELSEDEFMAFGVILLICAPVMTGWMLSGVMGEEYRYLVSMDLGGKAKVQYSEEDKRIHVEGHLGTGTFEKINFIAQRSEVEGISINSKGGKVIEGKKIGELVRERGLRVKVVDECSSACTFVFLSDPLASITEQGRVGFHTLSFFTKDVEVIQKEMAAFKSSYSELGLSDQFIEKVVQIPGNVLWYPSQEELEAGMKGESR